jgi:hypothetical protein
MYVGALSVILSTTPTFSPERTVEDPVEGVRTAIFVTA